MARETDALIDQIRDLPMGRQPNSKAYRDRMELYEQASAGLMKLLAVGVFFSDCAEHDQLWVHCIERLATRPRHGAGDMGLVEMQKYPTLLAMYARVERRPREPPSARYPCSHVRL